MEEAGPGCTLQFCVTGHSATAVSLLPHTYSCVFTCMSSVCVLCERCVHETWGKAHRTPSPSSLPTPSAADAVNSTWAPGPATTAMCVVSVHARSSCSNLKSSKPFSLFKALLGSGVSAAFPPPTRQAPRGPQSRPRAKAGVFELSHPSRSTRALLSIPFPGVFPFPRRDPAHARAPAEQQKGVEGLGG